MHAYLLISQNLNCKSQIDELAEKLKAKVMEFPLAKIEDVRNLNNLLRLSFNEPTLIVSENIHEAGDEALNAFLKNLEEPQPNIYFALTAPSERRVLPTIVSRCQIIKVQSTKYKVLSTDIEEFSEMSLSQKLEFFGKITDRAKAIGFIESLIFFLHEKKDLTNMELLLKTRTCLKANGTVNLHLTNLVVHYA